MDDRPKKTSDGLRGENQQQGDLQDAEESGRELPEGLKRERKGPLGPKGGRRAQ
jgi:hypothetical protein